MGLKDGGGVRWGEVEEKGWKNKLEERGHESFSDCVRRLAMDVQVFFLSVGKGRTRG